MSKTDLSTFDNSWYRPGGILKRVFWYVASFLFVNTYLPWPMRVKTSILRLFGARIEGGVVIKPKVNIKYPWKLSIGRNSWIGEAVWIDNLDKVNIGANVCISQGALILSGNHDFTKVSFDLVLKPIELNDGCWIGANTTVTQGVEIGEHAVLAVGSVASGDLEPFGIYRGNPATKIKERKIR